MHVDLKCNLTFSFSLFFGSLATPGSYFVVYSTIVSCYLLINFSIKCITIFYFFDLGTQLLPKNFSRELFFIGRYMFFHSCPR